MERDHARTVLEWTESHLEQMAELTAELCQLESPTGRPELQEPVFERLADAFDQLDFETTRVPGRNTGGYLYARPRERSGNRPLQLLLGHCDTVWDEGTLSRRPIRREDGRLYGPGAFDMKGGLVQGLHALWAVRALGLDLEVTPVFLINSDEEIGSPETTDAIIRLARHADRALVLEPALGPSGKLKTARKSGGHFLIEVSGVSAHAGLEPEKGVSAVVELSRLVQELHVMNDPERGISINVGTIRGGDRANVVADRCEAEVDVRVEHAEHMEQIREQIEELRTDHENAEIEITARLGRPPMEFTERNRALWKRAREAGGAIGIDLDHDLAGGSSDGNTASRFAATLDGLGAVGAGAHAEHEHVLLEAMPERTALLTLLLEGPPMCETASESESTTRTATTA